MQRFSGLDTEAVKISQGTPWSVHFEIKTKRPRRYNLRGTQSEVVSHTFSGHPDFVCGPGRRGRVVEVLSTQAVGETQSHTGENALTRSIGQVGIYSTGHLLNTNKTKIVSVVITKDLGGMVLATQLKGDSTSPSLSYKFVHSVTPLNLGAQRELELFCQVLSGALQWQGKGSL